MIKFRKNNGDYMIIMLSGLELRAMNRLGAITDLFEFKCGAQKLIKAFSRSEQAECEGPNEIEATGSRMIFLNYPCCRVKQVVRE
jgi:hypothetical protein